MARKSAHACRVPDNLRTLRLAEEREREAATAQMQIEAT
jgi:hypothetical protein